MNKKFINMDNYTLVETDEGIRKIETSDNIENMLLQENRVEAINKKINELRTSLEIPEIKEPEENFKKNFIEIVTIYLVSTTIFTLSLIEVPAVLLKLFATVTATTIVVIKNELTKYQKSVEKRDQYKKEYETLNKQIGLERIKLNSMSKHKEDDSKLHSKEIDLNDQKNYINNLLTPVEETIKIKQKSRFKK